MTFILLLLGPISEVQIRSRGFKMAGSHSNRSLHIYTEGNSADGGHQLAAAEREAGEGDLHGPDLRYYLVFDLRALMHFRFADSSRSSVLPSVKLMIALFGSGLMHITCVPVVKQGLLLPFWEGFLVSERKKGR
jgi:hypothetical protein